jgi:L-ascorbate metabolism protein UlaG (beta-lactamase superfamily)
MNMATELTWLGHGSWSLRIGDNVVLLDPFLDESPTSPVKAADVEADFILVSHGHFDHVSDVVSIANRTGATVVANFEISQWLTSKHNVKSAVGMNLGGQLPLPFGTVKMTVAWHSSQLPDGSYGGSPAGFLLTTADGKIYFACDTALFSDMRLIGGGGVDLAVLPIGDLFTMGPEDSLEAVKLINPARVIPNHYNTWPPIEQNAAAWADLVRRTTDAEPIVLERGGTVSL